MNSRLCILIFIEAILIKSFYSLASFALWYLSAQNLHQTLLEILIEVFKNEKLQAYRPQDTRLCHLVEFNAREKAQTVILKRLRVRNQQESDQKFGHMRHKIEKAIGEDHLVHFMFDLNGLSQRRGVRVQEPFLANKRLLRESHHTYVDDNTRQKEEHIVEYIVQHVETGEDFAFGAQEIHGSFAHSAIANVRAVGVKRIIGEHHAGKVVCAVLGHFKAAKRQTRGKHKHIHASQTEAFESLEEMRLTARRQVEATNGETHVGKVDAHFDRISSKIHHVDLEILSGNCAVNTRAVWGARINAYIDQGAQFDHAIRDVEHGIHLYVLVHEIGEHFRVFRTGTIADYTHRDHIGHYAEYAEQRLKIDLDQIL